MYLMERKLNSRQNAQLKKKIAESSAKASKIVQAGLKKKANLRRNQTNLQLKNLNRKLKHPKQVVNRKMLAGKGFITDVVNAINYIPEQVLKIPYDGISYDAYVSAAGLGLLAGGTTKRIVDTVQLNKIVSKVQLKIKSRQLLMKSIDRHNSNLKNIEAKMNNLENYFNQKEETMRMNFLGMLSED